MSNLIRYNPKFELNPVGFHNKGATCYFNAMIQSLLSCTSFISVIVSDKKKYNENPITKAFIDIIENSKTKPNSVYMISSNIWDIMMDILSKKNKSNMFMQLSGQQCAREGFHYLLDSIDSLRDIQNLFIHRYNTLIKCFDCDKCVSDVKRVNNLFEVQPELKNEQIDKFKKYHNGDIDPDGNILMDRFLEKQFGYVDKDFICPKCKMKGEKLTVDCLVMVPEILVVLSKKYSNGQKLDIYTNFPEYMEFTSNTENRLKYSAVSQIEHAGGLNGGHYWAICKRAGGWYNLNDSSISPGEFKPTNNTYMVFYHLN